MVSIHSFTLGCIGSISSGANAPPRSIHSSGDKKKVEKDEHPRPMIGTDRGRFSLHPRNTRTGAIFSFDARSTP